MELTDREFEELMDKIYALDPKEESALLKESYEEGLEEFLSGEDEEED